MSSPACCPNDRENAPLEYLHRLEVGIDSLANRLLVEPTPVAIAPFGDSAYRAWAHNLDTDEPATRWSRRC
jgi:hypothetical protein